MPRAAPPRPKKARSRKAVRAARPKPTALQRVAQAFARGGDLRASIESGLRTLQREVGARGASIWLWRPDGPARQWSSGRDGVDAAGVAEASAAPRRGGHDPLVVPLIAGRRQVGVLVVRLSTRLAAGQRALIASIAGVLGPILAQTELSRRLEETVAAGTREIDEQRAFFERIVDTLPVGLYVIDREFKVRAWNSKRETGLQGVSRHEVLGHTIFEVLHRQPAEVLRSEFEELFTSGEIQEFQTESTATGEPRTYRLTKLPMRIGGEITHAITIGEDITEWKKAEARIAQAEKLAALGTLAAGVMHEINNPLATIAAAAESLESRVRDGGLAGEPLLNELSAVLALIGHEVHRCSGIVNGVLDFSRPKPTHRQAVSLNTVAERTLFLLKHHSRFKNQRVSTEFDQALPDVVGNDEQLIQVLMALLFNAMDAMQGKGTVHLRTGTADDGQVMLEVRDEGAGIRRADLPRIFEPFYTTKPVGRGTGLGLSVCYSIVSDHGGRIEVTSTYGRGSAFRILLPAETAR